MIPFQQKDERWGSVVYTSCGNSTQTIGTSGCALLSLTNAVYTATGGRIFLDPIDLDNYSVKNGLRTANNGTSWGFFEHYVKNKMSNEFSITKTSSIEQAKAALKNFKCGIVISTHGNSGKIFTTVGHFVSIVDYTDDGYFVVFDSDFYDGKYNQGQRITERQKKRLAVNTAQRLIWVKPDLLAQEMASMGFVIVTYSPKNNEKIKEENSMEPNKIIWYSKPAELPSYFRPAVYKDIQYGVTAIVDSNGVVINPSILPLDVDGYVVIPEHAFFSAPKSSIEIQSDVKSYRRGKLWGIVDKTTLDPVNK